MILIFLFHFSMKFLLAKRIAPDGTPRFAASHLGLHYLPMPHKKDSRLKRVNCTFVHEDPAALPESAASEGEYDW